MARSRWSLPGTRIRSYPWPEPTTSVTKRCGARTPHVDPWLPGEGTKIVIPTQFVLPRAPNRGIVVNVAELRLYYFPAASSVAPEGTLAGSRRVITHPISIGRMDWSTPLGTTSVTGKVANPSWTPPQSIRDEHAARNDILPRVVPAGPDNPLGKHALRLGLPGYLIHGTNKPSGVGMRVTHGCIRMFPEDIEALFKTVPAGTPVMIVNQPYKLGWTADGLYLEAHPPLAKSPAGETDEVDEPSSADTAEAEPVLAEGSLHGAHACLRRRDGFENGRRSLGSRRNGSAVGSRRATVHLGRGRSGRRHRVLRRRSRERPGP